MKLLSTLSAAIVVAAIVPTIVSADSPIPLDYNNDNIVDVFDMVTARQSNASAAELETLCDFSSGDPSFLCDRTSAIYSQSSLPWILQDFSLHRYHKDNYNCF